MSYRGVLCQMSEEQFNYLVAFAGRHNLSLGDGLLRALRLARIVESLPEADVHDDMLLRQLAQRERRRSRKQ